MNIELPEPDCYLHLLDLVREGTLTEADLDDLVRPMLYWKFRFGLFDDPYVDPDVAERVVGCDANRQLALQAARETITLLKNERSLLPLDLGKLGTIAVIGPNAHRGLLGGYSGGVRSEAQAGHAWLQQLGLPAGARVELEQESVDSLENLRHARGLLQGGDRAETLPPVALLTSRYHLARCLLLARRLGFDGHVVAAEDALPGTPRYLALLVVEATYLMWIDLGVRWARLIGHRRMAARIS